MEKIISEAGAEGEEFSLYQLPILEDNFTYLLCQDGACVSIDPGDFKPVESFIKEKELTLEAVLITHFHSDHIGGVKELKDTHEVAVLGPKHEMLSMVDQHVEDEDELSIGPFSLQVLKTPGHTLDHVSYYFEAQKLLFCGDVLFPFGLGKMFEGNEQIFFSTLEKIKKLPKDTRLLTGHDYIQRNIDFIQFLDPSFDDTKYKGSTFTTLDEECLINPFMKVRSSKEFMQMYQKRDEFRSQKST